MNHAWLLQRFTCPNIDDGALCAPSSAKTPPKRAGDERMANIPAGGEKLLEHKTRAFYENSVSGN